MFKTKGESIISTFFSKGRYFMNRPRTDLALEMREIDKEERGSEEEVDGVEAEEEKTDFGVITRVRITNQNGSEILSKPVGTYVTIEIDDLPNADKETYDALCDAVCREIKNLAGGSVPDEVLIAGLGNRMITADALGPKTVDKIFVTRHLFSAMPSLADKLDSSVSAIAPGVLGITGIETAEIIKGVVRHANPKIVIAVDALAAREVKRLNSTIQLSNTGISPGSGVGNHRNALNEETLGVPVISIGVPTVIDAVTMAYDTVASVSEKLSESAISVMGKLSPGDLYGLIEHIMYPKLKNLTVTPKEVDSAIETVSRVVSGGINLALQSSLSIDEINSLLI